MLQKVDTKFIKMFQAKIFRKRKSVSAGNRVPSTSSIDQLDPFLDKDGVLRLGGRLVKSNFIYELKHPVLVPTCCTISKLIIRYYHEKTEHSGRGMSIN